MFDHAIRTKLIISNVVLILLIIGVGWLGLYRMHQINADLNHILNRRWSSAELARQGLSIANLTYRSTMSLVLADRKDLGAVNALLAQRANSSKKITEIQTQLEKAADSEPEKQLLERMREKRQPARRSLDRILGLVVQDGRPEDSREEMVNVTIPALNAYHATWNDLIQFEEQEMAKDADTAQARYAAARRLTSLLIILAIVVAIGIGLFTTRALVEEAAKSEQARAEVRILNQELERKVDERTRELARLAAVVNFSGDAIIGTTADCIVRSWNPAAERVYGYAASEVIGRPTRILAEPERAHEIDACCESLKRGGALLQFDAIHVRKDGREIPVSITLTAIKDPSGEVEGFAAVARDITEQRSMEKQLRQAQKMEAIGQLSGGIAHDFNNQLTVIIGYCESMEETLDRRDPLYKQCTQIKKAGQSAAALTRQLLAFSRQQVLEPKILEMNPIVLRLENILQRLIGAHIELHTALDPELFRIKADPGQIEQVIVNLAVNARDAMPHGGRLTIQTANVELDEEYCRHHVPQKPGRYVQLIVSDTGIGMDAATQSHIFEPFFTTKEVGKGTGLGLATVYGVVRQSKGHIWVYSEPGHGTIFKIYLPSTSEPVPPEKSNGRDEDSLHGSETILLVEDNDQVRHLARSILGIGGYRILEADSPERALEIARNYEGPIHLLLSDVIMPKMNGPALAEKMTVFKPDMKVLYMSGYTGYTHPGIIDSDLPHLTKPFTRETLLRRLREELSQEVRSTT